jgi:hypothetical protein
MTESEWQRKQADDTAYRQERDQRQEAIWKQDYEDQTGRDYHTGEYFDS